MLSPFNKLRILLRDFKIKILKGWYYCNNSSDKQKTPQGVILLKYMNFRILSPLRGLIYENGYKFYNIITTSWFILRKWKNFYNNVTTLYEAECITSWFVYEYLKGGCWIDVIPIRMISKSESNIRIFKIPKDRDRLTIIDLCDSHLRDLPTIHPTPQIKN